MVRMVTFRPHLRGGVMLKGGDEFEVSEEEAHAYASRKNPLAGPLDADEPPVAGKASASSTAPAPMAAVAKPAKAKPGRKPRKAK